ncbi:MAG: hypothetical protein NTY19_21710 [Planctomycetota bacterium]|nr:hypothetical protein [Planctomycetota bacterium]
MRKSLPRGAAALVAIVVAHSSVLAAGIGESKSYHGPTGLQLYSLRDQFKSEGVTPMLDKVRQWGFKFHRG